MAHARVYRRVFFRSFPEASGNEVIAQTLALPRQVILFQNDAELEIECQKDFIEELLLDLFSLFLQGHHHGGGTRRGVTAVP